MSKSVTRTIWIGTDADGRGGAWGDRLVLTSDGWLCRTGCGQDWWSPDECTISDCLDLPPPGEQRQYTITITPVEG